MGGPDILHAVNRAIDLKKRSLSDRFITRYCVPSSSGGLAAAASLQSRYAMQTDAVAKTRADALPEGITATCRPEFELGGMVTSNNEAERREVAPTSNEADLSQSSIPSLAHLRRAPRSLEPIVRRAAVHTEFDTNARATSSRQVNLSGPAHLANPRTPGPILLDGGPRERETELQRCLVRHSTGTWPPLAIPKARDRSERPQEVPSLVGR